MIQPAPLRRPTRTDELVELSIPALPELLSLPRLVAAAVSARIGFDVEAVEDVRLAIEELCLAALEGRGSGRLRIHISAASGALHVDCTFEPDAGGEAPVLARTELASELTEQILDALTDEHGTAVEEGVTRAWFRKSRNDTPAE